MEAFLLAILCIAVVGLAIRLSRISDPKHALASLADQVRRLEDRLTTLEAQITRATTRTTPGSLVAETSTERLPTTSSVRIAPEPKLTQEDSFEPLTVHTPPPPRIVPPIQPAPVPITRSISLEERLGQNWLSKIGIVLVVLGVATFLGYKLVTLGPLGKSLTGLATAFILLIGGLFLERRPTYRTFARAGIGGGWALLFFTTFALYHVDAMRVLTSQAADLILMAAVAAVMVWHSLRYKSQVVTALAFLLAFATVGISDITLFSLVAGALLAAALVYVAFRESWFELALAGLCGVYINHFLWLHRILPYGGQSGQSFPDFVPSAGLLLLYWLLFRLFYILRIHQNQRQQLIAAITAILNSAGLLALLKYQLSDPEWTFYILLVLGLVEFILAFLARPRNRIAFLVLLTIASALVLAAIPFHFAGSNWTLLWLFESETLFIAGILIRESAVRRLGLIAGIVAALQLLFVDTLPIIGLRLLSVDTGSHVSTAISLVTAALLFWFNSEFASRWNLSIAETEPGTKAAFDVTAFDRAALTLTSSMAALATAAFLYIEFLPQFIALAWSLLALVLLTAAWLLRRVNLTAQAVAVLGAAALRAFLYNLFEIISSSAVPFWSTRATTVSIASAVMFLCLPAAFAIRRQSGTGQAYTTARNPWQSFLAHPEQPFFFVPYALIAILIALELRTGMITLGWIALGLTAFLAALPIGERSYRLAGLGLLLLGLAKIVLVDIWSLPTTDRIVTLIVTGAVLLLVSFLYSRYRETILKFL